MKNSFKFFSNKACEYYPCHKELENINCLFCYCPLYPLEQCPGNFIMMKVGDKKVKDCSGCTFPHQAENYDIIIKMLSKGF